MSYHLAIIVLGRRNVTGNPVISGDQKFLEPFSIASPQINELSQSIRRLTSDNPNQQQRFEQLGPLITQIVSETNRVIAARLKGEPKIAQAAVASWMAASKEVVERLTPRTMRSGLVSPPLDR